MQNSVESISRGRRPPFLFQLLLIFICFAVFIVLSNKKYSYLSSFDLHNLWSVGRTRSPAAFKSPVSSPSTATAQDDVVSVKRNGNSTAAEVKWELCGLDNLAAIKNLTSWKRKVSHERHCSRLSVRCLVPLRAGYRVPILWPKSRDHVRMIR
ncbi:hypothetical protein VitviT2T_019014 [Vitis vinifera]|uniref:Methyltransferase n=1 Tax=Vitis vinifera TaxID=29760 RepID=A0ABY9D1P1_VITVI|nr:hypothetical protein VitviT2T_019014 [Vitis vinifera]